MNKNESDELIKAYIQEMQKKNKELEQKIEILQKELEKKEIQIQRLREESKKNNCRKESTGRKRNKNINDTEILKLRTEKKSIREIAKETGLSTTTIQTVIKKERAGAH